MGAHIDLITVSVLTTQLYVYFFSDTKYYLKIPCQFSVRFSGKVKSVRIDGGISHRVMYIL